MTPPQTTVHFTAVFLGDSNYLLTDEDLRGIARTIADDPLAGRLVPSVPNLRVLDRVSENGTVRFSVWYLTCPGVPHVEVVGFSESGKGSMSDITTKTIWKAAKVGSAIRLAYRLYRYTDDHFGPLF